MDLERYFHREPISERGISVVVPVFNEAECLEPVVTGLSETLGRMERSGEIILVDDGSADATGAIADDLASSNSRVRVIHHEVNQGYGAALRSGFQAAKYPLVLQIDGDETFLPEEIERLLQAIDQVDAVCGRRNRRARTLTSRLQNCLYHLLIRVVFAVPVRDANCGLKLYRRSALRLIPVQSNGRFVHAEILAKATFRNMLVGEVEVSHRARRCGMGQRPREPFTHVLREAARVFWRPQFAPSRPHSTPKERGRVGEGVSGEKR